MNAVESPVQPTGTRNVVGASSARSLDFAVENVPERGDGELQQNPLRELSRLGQGVWLDSLTRDLIRSGELRRLMDEDGLSGVMSNPVALEKAICGSDVYDADIRRLACEGNTVEAIRESLVVGDVQEAADMLRPLYDHTRTRDGYVSVELPPDLARNAKGLLTGARRLWNAVARPNVMVQVPATPEGARALRSLVQEGINVNVTFLFDLLRYREVLESWISGLDGRSQSTSSVAQVVCLAGFFLSGLDAAMDPIIERATARAGQEKDRVWQMRGQAAVAHARVAHVIQERFHAGFRFSRLQERGAQPMRLLWTGTGTRNPDYSDIKYVEPLIGHNTVTALPLETLLAYADHGRPASRLEEGLDEARRILYELPKCGIEFHDLSRRLEDECLAKLARAREAALSCIRDKCRDALRSESVTGAPEGVVQHPR